MLYASVVPKDLALKNIGTVCPTSKQQKMDWRTDSMQDMEMRPPRPKGLWLCIVVECSKQAYGTPLMNHATYTTKFKKSSTKKQTKNRAEHHGKLTDNIFVGDFESAAGKFHRSQRPVLLDGTDVASDVWPTHGIPSDHMAKPKAKMSLGPRLGMTGMIDHD